MWDRDKETRQSGSNAAYDGVQSGRERNIMCLRCWGVLRRGRVDSDGTGRVGWIYVDTFNGAVVIIRVLGVCDIPIAYAEAISYWYGSAGPSAQVCGASFWVSE